MKKFFLSLTVFTIFIFPTICSAGIFDYPTMAIIPFGKKASVSPDLTLEDATVAGNEIFTELMSQAPEKFNLLEREYTGQALQEIGFGMSGAVDMATAAQAGKMLGAQYLLVGSVDGLAVVKKSGEVIGIGSKSYKVVARISARVIETETARVVLAARGIGESTHTLVKAPLRIIRIGSDSVDQEQVSKAIQKSAQDLVKNLLANMDRKKGIEK